MPQSLLFFLFFLQFLRFLETKIFSIKFGASETLDVYIAAFKIPDLIFFTCATLISAYIIIPFLIQEEKNGVENFEFTQKLLSTFSIFISVVCIVVFFLTPTIAVNLFSGFSESQLKDLILYSRIFLLSPFFMSISYVFCFFKSGKGLFRSSSNHRSSLQSFYYSWHYFSLSCFWLFGCCFFGVILGAFSYLLLQLPTIFENKFF